MTSGVVALKAGDGKLQFPERQLQISDKRDTDVQKFYFP